MSEMTMPDRRHLNTSIADSRYILAAYYLGGCRNIVEIGGRFLHTFMDDDFSRNFWNIGPECGNEYWGYVKSFPVPALAFNFNVLENSLTKGPAGLCLLGLEMYDGQYGIGHGTDSLQHVCNNIHKFKVVVIEFVPDNDVACTQSLALLAAAQESGLKLATISKSEWVMDYKYPEPNDSFTKQREMWVLK